MVENASLGGLCWPFSAFVDYSQSFAKSDISRTHEGLYQMAQKSEVKKGGKSYLG
jgi:hypothetical protein